MTSEKKTPRPNKLSVIVFSGAFDKVHYALAMASAAQAINIPATLFFTMNAIRALQSDRNGNPGWHDLKPADDLSPAHADAQFAVRGVATFDELLNACRDLGVKFMVCEMGLRAIELSRDDLREDLDFTEGGLVTFYQDAHKHGSMVFV
jgi:peroxiredoxin family protein